MLRADASRKRCAIYTRKFLIRSETANQIPTQIATAPRCPVNLCHGDPTRPAWPARRRRPTLLAGRPCPPDAAAACCLATGGGPTQLTESVWPRPVSVAAGSQRHERAGWNGPAPLLPLLSVGSNALAPHGRDKGRDIRIEGSSPAPAER